PGASATGGGLAAPAMAANAITRSTGPVGAQDKSKLATKGVDAANYFGGSSNALPQVPPSPPDPHDLNNTGSFFDTMTLFGFLKLKWILELVGLDPEHMPKSVSQDIGKAEQLLAGAVQIYGLIDRLAGDDPNNHTNQI